MQSRTQEQDTPVPPDPIVLRTAFEACLTWELSCAQWIHRASVWPSVVLFFRAVSILSDGLIWYLAMPITALFGGVRGVNCMWRLIGMSVLNLLVYKLLKQSIGRPRPFKACPDIRLCAKPLDEYSFPSGHTLHAVAFGIVLSAYYPLLTVPLAVFAALVAVSRVVLGLHYPSDVVMGAGIGGLTAWAALKLF